MQTEKIEAVHGDLVILSTLPEHGPVPYGGFLYDLNGKKIARVIAEPERLSSDGGASRFRYKVEPLGELKAGSLVCFD
jgi:hypothetical protein